MVSFHPELGWIDNSIDSFMNWDEWIQHNRDSLVELGKWSALVKLFRMELEQPAPLGGLKPGRSWNIISFLTCFVEGGYGVPQFQTRPCCSLATSNEVIPFSQQWLLAWQGNTSIGEGTLRTPLDDIPKDWKHHLQMFVLCLKHWIRRKISEMLGCNHQE